MTAKEYLKQISLLDIKIKERRQQIEELKDLATSTGSLLVTDRVQSSPAADKMADTVARWVDMQQEITETIDELIKTKHKIISEIHQLDNDKYIQVLKLRYVNGMKWEQVTKEMNYTRQHVDRLHGWALREFTKKIMR